MAMTLVPTVWNRVPMTPVEFASVSLKRTFSTMEISRITSTSGTDWITSTMRCMTTSTIPPV